MKYFLRILLVLVLAVAAVTGSYYYTTGKTLGNSANQADLTTVSKQPATEKNAGKKLIASLEDEDFYLYKSDDIVILTHNNKSYEYYNWSRYIDTEEPELYYHDFDKDNQKELLVRSVGSIDEATKQNIYELYYLDPITDDDGSEAFDVTLLSHRFYTNLLDKGIIEEVSQLKTCRKIGQFVMNFASKGIKYDKATGIAKDAHSGYFSVPKNNNGEYLTIDSWSKGNGLYYVDDDNVINFEIDVNISFVDSDYVQQAGKIKLKLDKNQTGSFYIAQKTLKFVPNKQYIVADPTIVNTEHWSYVENNANKSTDSNDLVIDWLKYETSFNPSITTQTVSFGNGAADANGLKCIEVTDNKVVLTAKEAYTFDSSYLNGQYSVILNDKYDIAYTSQLSVEDNVQIITIQFDRSYGKDEIKSLKINYGSK